MNLQRAEVVEIVGKSEILTTWEEIGKGITACWYTMAGQRIITFPGDYDFPAILPDAIIQECQNAHNNQSTGSGG